MVVLLAIELVTAPQVVELMIRLLVQQLQGYDVGFVLLIKVDFALLLEQLLIEGVH